MKKHKTFKIFAIVVLVTLLFGCSTEKETGYESPQLALEAFYEEEGSQDSDIPLEESIIDEFQKSNNEYFLLKRLNEEKEAILYLVRVKKIEDGTYVCEKYTPDFAFFLPDNTEIRGEEAYLEFMTPFENMYFYMGEIYNLEYKPYYQGEELPIKAGSFYTLLTDEEDAEIELIKK